MVAPFTIDTVWQITAWVAWNLLWVGLGLSFVFWQRVEYVRRLPAPWPSRWLYYFGWIVTALAWGGVSFLMWWTPTAAIPAAAGTWNAWTIPLIFAIFLAPLAALFHFVFWRNGYFMVSWWILLANFILSVAVFFLFYLAVGGTPVDFQLPLIAAIISLIGTFWLLYLLIVVWQITRCTPIGPRVGPCTPHNKVCPNARRAALMPACPGAGTPGGAFYPVPVPVSSMAQISAPIAGSGSHFMYQQRNQQQQVKDL